MKKILLGFIFLVFFTCDDIIEVVDISDETISIEAPLNNSKISNTMVTFTWNALENTEHYHLQVATPTFENATQVVEDTLITKVNFSKTLDLGNYEWRVRAENSEYRTSYNTNAFSIEE